MKAKMPGKTPEKGCYLCTQCDSHFDYNKSDFACLCCGNRSGDDLVPIYMEDDRLEELFYCPVDWHGG